MRPIATVWAVVGLSLLLGAASCITFPDEVVVGASGQPFILKGTTTLLDDEGPCLVWVGDNGMVYHLFQGTQVTNETFDRVTTVGTESRLQLSTRSDLAVSCQVGTIVEVVDVLQIMD